MVPVILILVHSKRVQHDFHCPTIMYNNTIHKRTEYQGREKKRCYNNWGYNGYNFFYQNKDFVTGPHMIVVRADWFNIYTAHFLIAVLNFLRFNITSPACHSTAVVPLSWQQCGVVLRVAVEELKDLSLYRFLLLAF